MCAVWFVAQAPRVISFVKSRLVLSSLGFDFEKGGVGGACSPHQSASDVIHLTLQFTVRSLSFLFLTHPRDREDPNSIVHNVLSLGCAAHLGNYEGLCGLCYDPTLWRWPLVGFLPRLVRRMCAHTLLKSGGSLLLMPDERKLAKTGFPGPPAPRFMMTAKTRPRGGLKMPPPPVPTVPRGV